jgi:hypothetical protein
MYGCKEESKASLKSVDSSSGELKALISSIMVAGSVEDSFLFFQETKASILNFSRALLSSLSAAEK